VIRTPPTFPESALHSPFSLSQVTKKDPPLDESEAAEALLSLISLRRENIDNTWLLEHCDRVINVESEIISPETPLSPLFIPGSNLPTFTNSQGLPQNEIENQREAHVPRLRKPRKSKLNTILAALEGLRDA
jgi:hypothetical protein